MCIFENSYSGVVILQVIIVLVLSYVPSKSLSVVEDYFHEEGLHFVKKRNQWNFDLKERTPLNSVVQTLRSD